MNTTIIYSMSRQIHLYYLVGALSWSEALHLIPAFQVIMGAGPLLFQNLRNLGGQNGKS